MTIPPAPDRRSFLAGSAALLPLLLAPRLAMAQHATPLPALPADGLPLEAFLALSRAVTGHAQLDAGMGDRFHAALTADGGLAAQRDLYLAVETAAGDETAMMRALTGARLEAAKLLLRGWYLGQIPTASGETLIGYEQTLMARVTGDFIPLRSYCGGVPGYWSTPPELDDLPLRGDRR